MAQGCRLRQVTLPPTSHLICKVGLLLLLLLSHFSSARLCDPINGSPPGSPIPGILQARTLACVAISFSNARKWKVKVKSLSRIRLLATPWTAAYQAPPSMGFPWQECWSGLPLPSPVKWGAVSWIVASNNVRSSSLEPLTVASFGEAFTDVIKLRTLRWGAYPGLSWWALRAIISALIGSFYLTQTQTEEEKVMWPQKQRLECMAISQGMPAAGSLQGWNGKGKCPHLES